MSTTKEESSSDDDQGPSEKKIKIGDLEEPAELDPLVNEEIKEEVVMIKDEVECEGHSCCEESIVDDDDDYSDFETESEEDDGGHQQAIDRMWAELRPQKTVVKGPRVESTEGHIFQFTVTLLRGKGAPKIWRRFQVPGNYNFRQLHIAIQKAMGWKSVDFDYHLHAFRIVDPRTGYMHEIMISEDVPLYDDAKDENVAKIIDYFTVKNHSAKYEYDFGMSWQHEVVFEDAFLPTEGVTYPRCVDGAMACPPEDGLDSDEGRDETAFDAQACF